MTQEERKALEAFVKEYERLCDLFQVKPERHQSYLEVKKLLTQGEGE